MQSEGDLRRLIPVCPERMDLIPLIRSIMKTSAYTSF